MPVAATDLHIYGSLVGDNEGGGPSAVEIADADPNALWADVLEADRAVGGSVTKKWFLKNEHGTDDLLKPSTWVSSAPSGELFELGVGMNSSSAADPLQGTLGDWTSNAIVEVVSDGADTRTVAVIGKDAGGVPTEETVTLNGATAVDTVTVWSEVYAVQVASTSGSRIVTIKQGAAGATKGTIPTTKIECFAWVSTSSKVDGVMRLNLPAGQVYGFWERFTWDPDAPGQSPAEEIVSVAQNA